VSSIYVRNSLVVLTPMHEGSNYPYYKYQDTGTDNSEESALNLRAED